MACKKTVSGLFTKLHSIFSAWLRRNCMEIFHYVAEQTKDMPLFECGGESGVNIETSDGALYNDHDYDASELVQDCDQEGDLYTQSTNLSDDVTVDKDVLVPQSAVDHAILEADKTEGTLYNALSIDHDLVDMTSGPRDPEYLDKVYKLVVFEWRNILTKITEETVKVYEMKHRLNWHGADSVYDAWLISMKLQRNWFPYGKFNRLFPHWRKTRSNNDSSTDESSASTEESAELQSGQRNKKEKKETCNRIIGRCRIFGRCKRKHKVSRINKGSRRNCNI